MAPPEPAAAGGRSVVLVGHMGAGKSFIGRRLAERLGMPFRDADAEIEKAAGCPISDIFEIYGEPAFRDCESKVLARLLAGPPGVIATGGGAFMDPETRARVRAHGVSVWLKAELEVLLARVGRRNHRPLLAGSDARATLQRLIAERDPVYAEADLVIETARETPDATIERLIAALEARVGAGR